MSRRCFGQELRLDSCKRAAQLLTSAERRFQLKGCGWGNGTLTTTRRAFRTASRDASGWPKVDSVFFTKPSFMSAIDIAVRMPAHSSRVFNQLRACGTRTRLLGRRAFEEGRCKAPADHRWPEQRRKPLPSGDCGTRRGSIG